MTDQLELYKFTESWELQSTQMLPQFSRDFPVLLSKVHYTTKMPRRTAILSS